MHNCVVIIWWFLYTRDGGLVVEVECQKNEEKKHAIKSMWFNRSS